MSSFYGGFTLANGSGGIDPSVKIDYDQITNAPIKELYGSSPSSYISLPGLDYGHYTLSGYFKQESSSAVQKTEQKFELYVIEDIQTKNKVITYNTIENGVYYINILIYSQFGDLINKNKIGLNDEETKAYWKNF